jgi:hypothetical protein
VEGGTAPPAAAKRAALSRKPPSTLDALTREGKIRRQGLLTRPAVSNGSPIGNISTSNASSPAGAPAARAAGAEAAGAEAAGAEAAGAEAAGAKAAGSGPGWSM